MQDKLKNDKFQFNQKAIKYLSDIVNNSTLTEIEYKCGDISIKVSKRVEMNLNGGVVAHGMMSPMNVASMGLTQPVMQSGNDQINSGTSAEVKTVKAPVVGKIYVADKPGAPSLVKVGDKVEVDQKIFIIEAMKVMNNVKSTVSGIVKKILIQDGQAVEYGQILIEVE